MMYLKLALLNLWKYRRRMLVVLVGVVISVVVMEVVGGMLNGMRTTFFSEILRGSGHVQYHAEGWEDRLNRYSVEYMIDNPDRIVDELRSDPDVARAEPILSFGAVVSGGEENIALEGRGVMRSTEFFPDATTNIRSGTFLPEDDPGLALSTSNAELLGLSLGDTASVLVETTLGSPWYLTYPVTGLYESGQAEIDQSTFFISHADAQELVFAEGQTNEIRVSLRDAELAPAFLTRHSGFADANDMAGRTWREIHGSLLVFVEISDLLSAIINAFVVIVAATVITNAVLMTAFDRIGTFGALRAIGMKRRQLWGMIVWEGTAVGLIGSLLGLAIGVPVVLYFQTHGLDIGEFSEYFGTGQTYYFAFAPATTARNFGYGLMIAALSAAYAGWATARMDLIGSLQEA